MKEKLILITIVATILGMCFMAPPPELGGKQGHGDAAPVTS